MSLADKCKKLGWVALDVREPPAWLEPRINGRRCCIVKQHNPFFFVAHATDLHEGLLCNPSAFGIVEYQNADLMFEIHVTKTDRIGKRKETNFTTLTAIVHTNGYIMLEDDEMLLLLVQNDVPIKIEKQNARGKLF